MKSHWQTKTLEELCDFSSGLWKGETPPFVNVGVIRNTNFATDGKLDFSDVAYLDVEEKKLEKRRLRLGDIILEKSGGGPKQPVGRVALFDRAEGDFSFSNFTASIRVRSPEELSYRFLHKFLFWTYMSGITEGMQSHSTGIRNLDNNAYKAIRIAYPPRPEQQRIASILDDAFEGIATAAANADRNLSNARELFDSYLESALAKLGTGYKETNLGDEVDLQVGFAFKSPQYTENPTDVRLLRGDNIIQGALRWDDVKRWSKADVALYKKYNLEVGDVVLAMDRPWVNSGLKRAQITKEDLPCLLVQRVARLRGNDDFDSGFLLHLINSRAFINHILGIQTGLGVPHISGQQIKDFAFLKPPIAKQAEIAEHLNSLECNVQRLESIYRQKLAALAELKKSILHQAFTGQLH
jgi:type I restriction enzyme S subunit